MISYHDIAAIKFIKRNEFIVIKKSKNVMRAQDDMLIVHRVLSPKAQRGKKHRVLFS